MSTTEVGPSAMSLIKIGPDQAMRLLSRPWHPSDEDLVRRTIRGLVDLVESMERHGATGDTERLLQVGELKAEVRRLASTGDALLMFLDDAQAAMYARGFGAILEGPVVNEFRAVLAASPAAPEGATGCTRSHPHELMGQHCLLLTEIERLKSEIRWVSGVCSGAVELVDCMDDTEALRRIKERLDMAAPPAHTPAEGLAAIAQDLAARQTTLGPEINTALARAGSKLYDDGGAPHTPAAGALNGVAAAIEIRDVLRGYAGELTAATSQWLNRMCVAPPPTAQPPQQTTAAIAANAMRVVVSCAEDYLNAVAALGKVKEGKTLFDHSPIKDEEAYNAWTALNDTGKRLRECVERLRPAITEEPTR